LSLLLAPVRKSKIRIYLDTSVVSALFDKRNPQRQNLTHLFFEKTNDFDTYVSELVLAEIDNTKDLNLRTMLKEKATSFEILPISEESRILAEEYIRQGAIPTDYSEDALHISIATINGINFLLSWNFEHIVKVRTRRIVNMVNILLNYSDLDIVTPAELI
jgi:predicted nucleic acid-binding protein